jgi:NAD(P)-dependent dehydrogenase (short-subunit alcohol dehydrogenase family)
VLLNNRLALVTGAAQGAGAAIAMGLAREGAQVIVSDIDLEGAQRTARAIVLGGGKGQAIQLDVTNADECAHAAEMARAVGTVSILVNNAGVRPRHEFHSDSRDRLWQQAMDVNVNGIRNATLAFLDALSETKGSVINITSITASKASPMSIAYSTSKAAAQMLSKVLALELAHFGVRVNAVAPGVMETEMTRSSRDDPQRRHRLLDRIPMGRFGDPTELVGPVVFLASPMASYMTGATLCVDGGYLAT